MPDSATVDYRRPGVWDDLAAALETRWAPRLAPGYGHVTCEPGWSWLFAMPDHDLWLVSAGQGQVVVEGEPVAVGPGSLLVLRPGDRGHATQDLDRRLTVTYTHFRFVRPGTTDEVGVPGAWLPSRHVRLTDPWAVQQPLLEVARLRDQGDRFAAVQAGLLLTQALLETYRQDAFAVGAGPRRIDPRVADVVRQVRSRPAERPTLAEMAALVHLSPTHLRRLFAREMGIGFRAFVVRARLDRARELLRESSMSVSEVARALGYSDLVLFSRQFRHHHGHPPSHLRR